MPKVVIPRYKNNEQRISITERTKTYNVEIKKTTGKDKVSVKEIANYLGCSKQSVYRYLKGVRRCGGTTRYNSIDVARKLAEREVGIM